MLVVDRIEMCDRFMDRTELGDAVENLLCAANILLGIGFDYEAEISLLTAENLIRTSLSYDVDTDSWEEYEKIDEVLYEHLFKDKKMTKEEFDMMNTINEHI